MRTDDVETTNAAYSGCMQIAKRLLYMIIKQLQKKMALKQTAAADGKDLLRSIRNGIEARPS